MILKSNINFPRTPQYKVVYTVRLATLSMNFILLGADIVEKFNPHFISAHFC